MLEKLESEIDQGSPATPLGIRHLSDQLSRRASSYERGAEELLRRWVLIHYSVSILVAVTTSGSAIGGWNLWEKPYGKQIWAILAGLTSLFAIIHAVMGTANRIKHYEHMRLAFGSVFRECDSFYTDLIHGRLTPRQADKGYDSCRGLLQRTISNTHADLTLTRRLRHKFENTTGYSDTKLD